MRNYNVFWARFAPISLAQYHCVNVAGSTMFILLTVSCRCFGRANET